MQGKLFYWFITTLAGASIALVIVDGAMFLRNQAAQVELSQRNQLINQNVQFGRAYEALVRGLAAAAANSKDDQIRDLLAQHGFTLTVNPPPAAPSSAGQAAPPVTGKN